MQLCLVQTVVRLADENDVAIMPSDILTCCCQCCPLMMLLLLMLLLLLLSLLLLMPNCLETIFLCFVGSFPLPAKQQWRIKIKLPFKARLLVLFRFLF